jgi:hypothetical protein
MKIHVQIFFLDKTKPVSAEPWAGVFVRSLRRSGATVGRRRNPEISYCTLGRPIFAGTNIDLAVFKIVR